MKLEVETGELLAMKWKWQRRGGGRTEQLGMRELLVEVQMRSKQSSILSVGDCRTPIRAKSSLMVINAAAAGLGELVSSVVDGPAVYVVNVMTRNENPVKLKTENRTNRLSRLEKAV